MARVDFQGNHRGNEGCGVGIETSPDGRSMEVAVQVSGLLLAAAATAILAGQAFAQDETARKGTRNNIPADAASTTAAKEVEARVNTLEGCMASWDASTHISKEAWHEICQRELRARAAHSGLTPPP